MRLIEYTFHMLWLALLMLIICASFYYLATMPASGPNCPGLDPAWLGFCEGSDQ